MSREKEDEAHHVIPVCGSFLPYALWEFFFPFLRSDVFKTIAYGIYSIDIEKAYNEYLRVYRCSFPKRGYFSYSMACGCSTERRKRRKVLLGRGNGSYLGCGPLLTSVFEVGGVDELLHFYTTMIHRRREAADCMIIGDRIDGYLIQFTY